MAKKNNYWNYRVVTCVREGLEGMERSFSITDVHYENNVPITYGDIESEYPPKPLFFLESVEFIGVTLDLMKGGLEKPVLDLDDWPNEFKDDKTP